MTIPFWLIIVLIAHLTYAVVFLADRFVVSKAVKNEYVYTVYINILSLFAFILAPFGLTWISPKNILIALVVGGSFALASLFFFKSLQIQPATRVAPFIGGIIPIFTFIFSYLFFQETLSNYASLAIILLIAGSLLIAYNTRDKITKKISVHALKYMLIASVLFGLSFATTRLLFLNVDFVNGLIWSRTGSILVALLFLLSPTVRKAMFKETKKRRPKKEWLILSNKIFGAGAYVLLLYAISLTSATIVNALQGVQYVFLIFLVIFFHKKYPKLIDEKLLGKSLIITVYAVAFIVTGLMFISL